MAEVVGIPIRLVSPHPKLATRLKLEVGSLAALIREAVDEDVPNGQLEPGRVTPREDGEGYFVYIGVRRFYALKSLYEETGDERFAIFNAYVDSKEKSLLDLFLRVRSENEQGKGERVGLSVLEKIFGLHKISGSVSPEKLDDELKRELAVAEKLDEKRIMKLFEMETAAHFGFRLEHLERLCQMEDAEELFESAACTAGFALPPERIEKAVEGRDAAHTLKWFGSLFPEYTKGREERPSTGKQGAPAREEPGVGGEGDGKGQDANAPDQGPLEVHEKEVIIAPCPACGIENMLQMRLNAEVTRLSRDPEGESVTAAGDAVVSCAIGCYHCAKKFQVFIKPLGGRRFAVEVSLSPRFREPKEEVEAVDLRFDREKEVWQKIAGERVVGLVRTRGRAKEARV
jgi:hypothetical protein